ncbi:MAG: DUF2674 domain-containing protein [Rickettsiaceae bacterium]|jgi:hypothetical protein|nr:DUF2674 domain-containing protein [Rickettsiales bacterium]MCP5363148.1 DUF2674 domain-containing protein [Rickettsiaceae bacterium]MCP5377559.1 DUF2674 domain-containing protein [Rickettsiaceae bacterium]WPX99311.1 DUF2674 domain-containing protein [Candidatus Megaera polyxenophila]
MVHKKPLQKFISFTDNSPEFEAVKEDMKSGWSIISLVKNGVYYVGIMEKNEQKGANESDSLFIPPRKKLKISFK